MKNTVKRSLSLLLVLTLLVGLLSGLTFHVDAAGTVDYVYNGKYIYNWGKREEEATFLSPMAEAFYEDNGTSYAELSALSGSATTSSVPSSALYQELKSLMSSNHTTKTSYDGTRELYRYTDCQQSGNWNSGKISSFYSGKAIGPGWDSGKTWNREHTWPNSKGDASGQGENDIIMLRPASVSENSSRGNKAYGESSGYYHPNSESGGTYDLRGDVARIMLFVYCRWGNTGSMWGSSGVMESRDVLLKWVEEDPVDTWELGRNDSTEAITGTRNVFVDYPELIFIMFGQAIPSDMPTPSGEASKNAYTVTATTNNSSYGTVSVNGNVITATPKTGYQVSGYTVTSGSATVTQSGNTFTVRPSSDCTVRINFTARSKYTVKFSENGLVKTTVTPYAGDSFQLPAASVGVDSAYTFVGWVKSMVSDTTTKPATVYSAGKSYTATSSHTMYGLYTFQYMGNTYYSTNATPCAHDDDTLAIPAAAATCTASGNTAGRYCNDCGHYYGGYSVIPAQGHSYSGAVTPPTVTEQGYTTYTCGTCGDSYVSDYVDALGYTYTVRFSVPSGVAAVAEMTCGKSGITLPSADAPAGETNYTFVGWAAEPVADSQTAPALYNAGSKYNAAADTTLYAVYTYLVGGTTVAGTYELITAEHSNWEGEYVITGTVASDNTVYAFLADGTEPNTASAAKILSSTGMTLNGDKLTNVTDQYVVVIEKVGTHYSIRLKGASSTLYLMTTNNNSGLNTATSTSATSAQWDISHNGSEVVIRNVASTSRTLRFNASSKQFRTYTSGQNAVVLYGMAGNVGVKYYTILDSAVQECTYAYVDNGNGTHSYKCSDCGSVEFTEAHSYGETTVVGENAACVCGKEVFGINQISMELQSSLSVKFRVPVSSLDLANKTYYAKVIRYGADGTTEEKIVWNSEWANYNANYKFVTYSGVSAKQMNDKFVLAIFDAEGNQLSVNFGTTIAQYALSQLNLSTTTDALKTVYVDLLNYGAAAQIAFKYDTENPANAGVTAQQQELYATKDMGMEAIAVAGAGYYKTTLSLGNRIEMKVWFKEATIARASVAYAVATWTNYKGVAKSQTIEESAFIQSGNYYQVVVNNTGLADCLEMVTVTLYDATGNVLSAVTDSVGNYVAAQPATANAIYFAVQKLAYSASNYFTSK